MAHGMTRRSARSRLARGAVALVAIAAVGAASSAAVGPAGAYLVRPGDTVDGLAARYGVTPAAIVAANHLKDANRIYAGARLIIPPATPPGGGTSTPAPAGPSGGTRAGPPAPLAPVTPPPPGRPRFPTALLSDPNRLALRPYFQHWAAVFGVPAGLVEAVGWMESGWRANVVSSTGAVGIGQIEPQTDVFISTQLLGFGAPIDPRLPDNNIRMTAAYLAWLLRQTHGSVADALGAYYQGLTMLRSKGPLDSTRRYVAVVGGLWAQFRSG
jgi:N-acetylmuramoyl-L-alanine amidase